MKTPLVVDIETQGTAGLDGFVVTLAWKLIGEPGRAHVEAVGHTMRAMPYPDDLLEMMADPLRPFVSFTKYDARYLGLTGVEVTGPFYDVQTQCWVDNENQPLSLAACARRYCHIEMDKRLVVRQGVVLFTCDDGTLVRIEEAPLDQLYKYNVEDTETEATLFEEMWERLHDGGWLDYWLQEEVPFTNCLTRVESRGLPIDEERRDRFTEEMEAEHEVMLEGLYETSGLPRSFNLNSNDQLAAYLFHKVFELADSLDWGSDAIKCLKSCLADEHDDCEFTFDTDGLEGLVVHPSYFQHVKDLLPQGFEVLKIGSTQVHGRWTLKGRGLRPGVRTDSGKLSVSRPVLKVNLSAAKDEWVQDLLGYRSVDKLLTTYLRSALRRTVNGRIYGRFNQTGTKTGRLSSSEPNLQNIPSHGALGPRTRDLFRPAA